MLAMIKNGGENKLFCLSTTLEEVQKLSTRVRAVYVKHARRTTFELCNTLPPFQKILPVNFNRRYEGKFSPYGIQLKADVNKALHQLSVEPSHMYNRHVVTKICQKDTITWFTDGGWFREVFY